ADRPGAGRVVLVDPEPQTVRFRDVAQERVHDRETLRGAGRRGCDLQARGWAGTLRHREDSAKAACAVALSQSTGAEDDSTAAGAMDAPWQPSPVRAARR